MALPHTRESWYTALLLRERSKNDKLHSSLRQIFSLRQVSTRWAAKVSMRREAVAKQVRSWGGDRVVIDDDDLESNLAQSLNGAELDIVVDAIGGRATRQLVHHLRFGGTLVTYAVLSGHTDSADVLFDLIGRHVNWTGFWETNWLHRTDTALVHSAYRDLLALVADGTLSARADRTMRLEDWKDAVSLTRADKGREGKVVFVFVFDEHEDIRAR
jgi:NADPH:quinone reductase-like Zn-dependent oxidoreductase